MAKQTRQSLENFRPNFAKIGEQQVTEYISQQQSLIRSKSNMPATSG